MNRKCRYIDFEGVCTVENKLCDGCKKSGRIAYRYALDPFNDTTDIVIEYKGRRVFSCCFSGQMSPPAIEAYAREMTLYLSDKGVI